MLQLHAFFPDWAHVPGVDYCNQYPPEAKVIPIDLLNIRTQKVELERVADLTRVDDWPPLMVVFANGRYWLDHGHHRVIAALVMGKDRLAATVYPGRKREAEDLGEDPDVAGDDFEVAPLAEPYLAKEERKK